MKLLVVLVSLVDASQVSVHWAKSSSEFNDNHGMAPALAVADTSKQLTREAEGASASQKQDIKNRLSAMLQEAKKHRDKELLEDQQRRTDQLEAQFKDLKEISSSLSEEEEEQQAFDDLERDKRRKWRKRTGLLVTEAAVFFWILQSSSKDGFLHGFLHRVETALAKAREDLLRKAGETGANAVKKEEQAASSSSDRAVAEGQEAMTSVASAALPEDQLDIEGLPVEVLPSSAAPLAIQNPIQQRAKAFFESLRQAQGVTLVCAPDEGQCSEVWMMREDSGEFLAVFKPRRNDVSFVKGEGYLKEQAAWIVDALSSSQAGVPVTFCVEIKVANTTLEGSAQAFIAEGFDGNDYGYSGDPLHQEAAERLAVLDMRLANSVRGSHLDGRDILSLSAVL